MGPTNGMEAGSRSIEIAPPVNKTLEPRLTETLAHALRKQIQRDGTYKLNTKGDGDVIVTSTITRYHRQGLTYKPNDTLTVEDYRVQLYAIVKAYDRVTGRTLVEREFQGHTTVRVGSDQASAERQALPLLTEDLARAISSAIVDGQW
jgi:Lipopolysaccharide-assembly